MSVLNLPAEAIADLLPEAGALGYFPQLAMSDKRTGRPPSSPPQVSLAELWRP